MALPAIVTTLAKVAPMLAPVVKDVASGVIKGLTNRPKADLTAIADQFSRISGNFLNSIVNPGVSGVRTILPGGCVPPPDFKLPPDWKPPIIFPPNPNVLIERLMTRLDQMMNILDRLMDILDRLLKDLLPQDLQRTPSATPNASEPKGADGPAPGATPTSGGLYSEMLRTQSPSTSAPAVSSASTGPSSPTTPTSKAPAPSSPVSSEGLGSRTLERLFDDMNSVESQINGLDPNDPKAQFRLMQLQQKMQRITQMINLIAEMRKALHDTAMAIIRNIR
jgi:hypothetical protein